jgi:hypothetical protein
MILFGEPTHLSVYQLRLKVPDVSVKQAATCSSAQRLVVLCWH